MTEKRKKTNGQIQVRGDMVKLPPQDEKVEQAVLGAIIIADNNFDRVIGEFIPELFYFDKHQYIAEALIEMIKENKKIDILSVVNKLKQLGTLDMVGGAYYISLITSNVSSVANLEYHVKILQELALKRELIINCSITIGKGYSDETDVFQAYNEHIANLEKKFKFIIKDESSVVKNIHEKIIKDAMFYLENGTTSGVPTGLRKVDEFLNGWQKSDLIIIAGRPAMGKTALMLSALAYPAIEKNIPVGIFSLEMSKMQLTARLQSMLSGINVSNIVKQKLTADQIKHIAVSCTKLETAPIHIDDTPALSIFDFRAKARRMVSELGCQVIAVDYLQLMRGEAKKNANRENEIAEISRALKSTAKELNIPIIALAQLSRAVENRPDKKPSLADLRESGQIEQDADLIIFPFRPEYYKMELYEIDNHSFDTSGLLMLIIAKHRNGSLGEIPTKFLGYRTQVTNLEDESMYQEYQSSNSNLIERSRPVIQPPEDTDKPIVSVSVNMYELGKKLQQESNESEDVPF